MEIIREDTIMAMLISVPICEALGVHGMDWPYWLAMMALVVTLNTLIIKHMTKDLEVVDIDL